MNAQQLELPGLSRKRVAHAHFESIAAGYLREARAYARRCCEVMGSVTADDVVEAVGKPPEGIHHNAIGAIFSDGQFYPIGWRHSKRPSNNGRAIRVWSLRS